MNNVDYFDYPEWVIPANTNLVRLKTEVDVLLEKYRGAFNKHRQSLYICNNCQYYCLHELGRVVKASLKISCYPVDVKIMDSIIIKVRIEIRITWLKKLQDKLNQMA